MSDPVPHPLAAELAAAVFDLSQQRAEVLRSLGMLHATLRTGGLLDPDSPLDLRWLLDACIEEIGRSVLDLALQGDALRLIEETRAAVDRAEDVLDSRWTIVEQGGAARIRPMGPALGRTAVPGSVEVFRRRADDCATTAMRLGTLRFLVPDGSESWPQDSMDRNRRFVRGPVVRSPDGAFSLGAPERTPPA